METEVIQVQVSIIPKSGKSEVYIQRNNEDLTFEEMRTILATGISLLVKLEDGPENQGRALKEVVEMLQSEFIDPHSFSDAFSVD